MGWHRQPTTGRTLSDAGLDTEKAETDPPSSSTSPAMAAVVPSRSRRYRANATTVSAHAPSRNASASRGPVRAGHTAGLIRSSRTRPTAPEASAPTCANAASHTPSRRIPTSGVTGTTAAVAAVDHQDSTGRSTDDATSLSAVSTASRASVESPPDTKRPPRRTKQRSVSRRFHSGKDPFEGEPRALTGKVRRVVAGGAGFAKIRFEPCPGASTVAR